MHCADMRTKDFQRCFDQLHHLRRFAIVASDMSNTVVELFGSYLPALRRIKLYNCHRFDGDVLVEALESRMQLRERKLEELVVAGCEGMTGKSKPGIAFFSAVMIAQYD